MVHQTQAVPHPIVLQTLVGIVRVSFTPRTLDDRLGLDVHAQRRPRLVHAQSQFHAGRRAEEPRVNLFRLQNLLERGEELEAPVELNVDALALERRHAPLGDQPGRHGKLRLRRRLDVRHLRQRRRLDVHVLEVGVAVGIGIGVGVEPVVSFRRRVIRQVTRLVGERVSFALLRSAERLAQRPPLRLLRLRVPYIRRQQSADVDVLRSTLRARHRRRLHLLEAVAEEEARRLGFLLLQAVARDEPRESLRVEAHLVLVGGQFISRDRPEIDAFAKHAHLRREHHGVVDQEPGVFVKQSGQRQKLAPAPVLGAAAVPILRLARHALSGVALVIHAQPV